MTVILNKKEAIAFAKYPLPILESTDFERIVGAMNNFVNICAAFALFSSWPAVAQDWKISFDDWHDDHLHWTAPSYVSLGADGTVTFFATHLANMRRTSSILDQGNNLSVIVELNFYSSLDCSGPVLSKRRFRFASLDYKEEKFDVLIVQGGPALIDLFAQAQCVRSQREWTPH